MDHGPAHGSPAVLVLDLAIEAMVRREVAVGYDAIKGAPLPPDRQKVWAAERRAEWARLDRMARAIGVERPIIAERLEGLARWDTYEATGTLPL
jgi:hypothetical protein